MKKENITFVNTDFSAGLCSDLVYFLTKPILAKAKIKTSTLNASILGDINRIIANQGTTLQESPQESHHPESTITIEQPSLFITPGKLKNLVKQLNTLGLNLPTYPFEHEQEETHLAIRKRYMDLIEFQLNKNSDGSILETLNSHYIEYHNSDFEDARNNWSNFSLGKISNSNSIKTNSTNEIINFKTNETFLFQFIDTKGNSENIHEENFKIGDLFGATYTPHDVIRSNIEKELNYSKAQHSLFSLLLDPKDISDVDSHVFGMVVQQYLSTVFEKYSDQLKSFGVVKSDGVKDILIKIENKPGAIYIEKDIIKCFQHGAELAMTDLNPKEKQTVLHIPGEQSTSTTISSFLLNSGKTIDNNGFFKDTNLFSYEPMLSDLLQELITNLKLFKSSAVSELQKIKNIGLEKGNKNSILDRGFIATKDGTLMIKTPCEKIKLCFDMKKNDIILFRHIQHTQFKNWVNIISNEFSHHDYNLVVFCLFLDDKFDKILMEKIHEDPKLRTLDVSCLSPRDFYPQILNSKNGKILTCTAEKTTSLFNTILSTACFGNNMNVPTISYEINKISVRTNEPLGKKSWITFKEKNILKLNPFATFLALVEALNKISLIENELIYRLLSQYLKESIEKAIHFSANKVGLDARLKAFYVIYFWCDRIENQKESRAFKKIFHSFTKQILNKKHIIIGEFFDFEGQKIEPLNLLKTSYKTLLPSKTLSKIYEKEKHPFIDKL